MTIKCPTCRQPVEMNGPDRPFCSERCRLLDLGAWASGQFTIPAEVTETIELEHRPPSPESDAER